jgi:Domain of unknown function (DUF1772)
MSGWAIPMLIGGGLFAGGASFVAWERIPTWRTLGAEAFRSDFARSIKRADQLQPALLVVTIVSTAGFAIDASGTESTLAFIAAGGYAITLAGSGAVLVPLQRRLIAGVAHPEELLRRRWYRGHVIRTAAAIVSFGLTAVAVAAEL